MTSWLFADDTTGVLASASQGADQITVTTLTGSFPVPTGGAQFAISIGSGTPTAELAFVTTNNSGIFSLTSGLAYSHVNAPVAVEIAAEFLNEVLQNGISESNIATAINPGASGNYLTSTGASVWVSAPPTGASVTQLPVINAVTYGADPTGTTDSGGAINSAIAAAGSSTLTNIVYLPAGTYLINTGITMNKNGVVLKGAGQTFINQPTAPTILSAGPSFSGAVVTVASSGTGPIYAAGINDLYFAASTSGQGTGLAISSAVGCEFRTLGFSSFLTCMSIDTNSSGVNGSGGYYEHIGFNLPATNGAVGVSYATSSHGGSVTNEAWYGKIEFQPSQPSAGSVTSVHFGRCASILFDSFYTQAPAGAGITRGIGVVYDYSQNSALPSDCTIRHPDFAAEASCLSVANVGSPGGSAYPNHIYDTVEENGPIAANPTLFPSLANLISIWSEPTPSQPSVPASNVAQVNNNIYPVNIYVTGAASVVAINGINIGSTGNTGGQFRVPVNGTITLGYSTAPTWVWAYDTQI